jgi:hypothetical protein
MNFKLNVAKFNSNGEFNYTEIGTLAQVGKGMSIKFTKPNLASDKRVTLILTDKNDVSHTLPCSAPLSNVIRKALKTESRKAVLGALTKLTVMQDNDDEEKYFLMQPAGQGEESILISDLKAETVTYEELLEML